MRILRFAISLVTVALMQSGAALAANKPTIDRDTVVVALDKEVRNLDAQVTSTGDSIMFGLQLYDTLYGFDMKGNLVPRMATDVKIGDGGRTYTFTLRPGVKFHNGATMTAADVKYSIERIIDPVVKSTRRVYFAPIIESVETSGDRTVTMKLKEPDGAFLNKVAGFLYIVPKAYCESLPTPEDFAKAPIGTGPWKLRNHQIGQLLELERFDDFWGEKPGAKRLVMKMITEPTTRVNALLTGEVDIAMVLPYKDVARLKTESDLEITSNPNGGPLYIRLYSDDPSLPTYKREVRQALQYAIDSKSIIKNIFAGIGEPMATFISRSYPYGFDPELKPYPYDPKKARELLAKAGYPKGFDFKIYSGSDQPKEATEAVVAYWGQIGVRTQIIALDYAAWSRLNNTHKNSPAAGVQQFSNAIYDPIHPVGGSFAKEGTWSNYYNPEVEALLTQLSSTTGADARGAAFRKIGRILHDDAATILITELNNVYGKKRDLRWAPQPGIALFNFRTIGWK
jgi:peptide/nickel transport system substrate-binding protein